MTTPSEAVRVAVDEIKRLAMAFHALGRESLAEPSAACYAELCAAIDALAALSLHVGDAPDSDTGAPASPSGSRGCALESQSVSTADAAPIPGAEPVAWAIYDSQGFYEARATEDEARRFCDRYNQREVDPLKPYKFSPIYASPTTPTEGPAQTNPAIRDALERLRFVDRDIWEDIEAALREAKEGHHDAELDELDCTLLLDLLWLYRHAPLESKVRAGTLTDPEGAS